MYYCNNYVLSLISKLYMANNILLRDVPEDVLKKILKIQSDEKQKKLLKQYSISLVIFKIIRDIK